MQRPEQLRDLAERCFRLASQVVNPTDAEMLRSIGRECERSAAAMTTAEPAVPARAAAGG
jgi:hypothetical protein